MDSNKYQNQIKILNIACFAGSLYLLIDFVFNFVIRELNYVVKFPF